jgi:lipoate-protein ligase B
MDNSVDFRSSYALQSSLHSSCLSCRSSTTPSSAASHGDATEGWTEECTEATPNTLITLTHTPVYTLGRRGCLASFHSSLPTTGPSNPYLSLKRGTFSSLTAKDDGYDSLLGVSKHTSDYHVSYAANLHKAGMQYSPLTHPLNRATLLRIDRGGDVTYHGPGQITAYPIIDLTTRGYAKDLHEYVTNVEEVVIRVLGTYGVEGVRDERGTGVWVTMPLDEERKKIATVGIGCSNWITKHGFAINVTRQVYSYFDEIVPCGINDGSVTTLQDVLEQKDGTGDDAHHDGLLSMEEVGRRVVDCFQEVFDKTVVVK